MNPVLHYIYDPLCGWCYGAEPLVWAASKVDGLALSLHLVCGATSGLSLEEGIRIFLTGGMGLPARVGKARTDAGVGDLRL